ncbi:tRNA-pseudouridine synthase [Cyathus striatus]|nr:tRNA-pseudouridine synthase [Cyathus striatus]
MVTQTSDIPERVKAAPGLKKIAPYWYPYTTMAKLRWLGRELLEVVSTEFRDRSTEYYRYALESGVTTVNGKVAKPDTIIRNGDRIENIVHRHEPAVADIPIKILYHDVEREFIIVDKPGSIPVHPCGRYNRNTLIWALENEFGFEKVYSVNRLDRLTSGLMIVPLSARRANQLTNEFIAGTVRKEYLARVNGKFPDEEIICEEPLLTIDRQMGLNIVHPQGKPAKTIFNLIHYDGNSNTSVVRCHPWTGRSHQLRVHLQYLGYPIANDPVYSEERVWGTTLGKGGIDIVPSDERSAPAPPPHLQEQTNNSGNPEFLSNSAGNDDSQLVPRKLLPRETGEDIGMGSPVPLSKEAVEVVTYLRNMKDEDEDWSRWRDMVFRAKGALNPHHVVIKPPPPQNRRKRGGQAEVIKSTDADAISESILHTASGVENSVSPPPESALKSDRSSSIHSTEIKTPSFSTHNNSVPAESATSKADGVISALPTAVNSNVLPVSDSQEDLDASDVHNPSQLTTEEIIQKISEMEAAPDINDVITSEHLYCPECYLPLNPDPKPEKLYIFLHALKYTTSLGTFETEMPHWAAEGYTWKE